MPTLVDFVALSLLPLPWRCDIATALREGHAPSALLNRLITERPGHPPRSPELLRSRARAVVARAADRPWEGIPWSDPDYPPALAAIVDFPPVLWINGQRSALSQPSVAIVGSRAGSPYALSVAERLAADLSERGITIVSGLARGVDSAAHRGALAAGGTTIGVLGSGLATIYPEEHTELAREMTVAGALISELVPDTPPRPRFFPRRNRIISGLARAVVVIEAGEKSGSLITARCALEQGRDVLAVPGNVLSGRNRGGHALLRDGAKIVESADDILEELGVGASNPGAGQPASKRTTHPAGDPLLACLPAGECCDVDEISERSGWTPARLLPRLLDLELRGLIRRAGGGRFMRI